MEEVKQLTAQQRASKKYYQKVKAKYQTDYLENRNDILNKQKIKKETDDEYANKRKAYWRKYSIERRIRLKDERNNNIIHPESSL